MKIEGRGDAFAEGERTRLTLSAGRVERWLYVTLLVLGAVHLITWYLNFHTSLDLFTLFRVFDFDEETNVPTLFNTLLFVIPALLALTIGLHSRRERARYAWHWIFLGAAFALLAVDEFTSIHETLVEPTRRLFDIEGGFFYLAWVIPAIALCLLGALLLFRFVLQLPPRVRRLLIIAAMVYLIGAVGLEMVQGFLTTSYPEAAVMRRIVTFFEEFLEMTGLIILIRGLFAYMVGRIPPLELDIVP